MEEQHITCISFGSFGNDILEMVTGVVAQEFGYPVAMEEGRWDLSDFFDPARRQYNGDKLLKQLHGMQYPSSLKVIGLFNVDLFIPILTFIFGQAQLGGKTAIASVYRLMNERYGLAPDEGILKERLVKEVVHELGHTFGLIHCRVPDCVMRPSTYVEDIDQKEVHLCPVCRSQAGIRGKG